LAVARALARDLKLLLLDEHTHSLAHVGACARFVASLRQHR
jgi:ABC-type branched-subunit amino acid transport system ATPase component